MKKPSLFNRLKYTFQFYRHGFGALQTKQAGGLPFYWPVWKSNTPMWHISDYQSLINDGFNRNSILYSAAMYKYYAFKSVPLRAYKGSFDKPELLPADHPLQKLCLRPNRFQSGPTFQGLADIFANVAGTCYIYIKKVGGQPDSMYLLRPDRVYITPLTRGPDPIGYYYVPEGRGWHDGIPYKASEIMCIRMPNPGDDIDGLGEGLAPGSVAAKSINVDNMITDFLQLFFQNGAMPPGYFSYDTPMTDDEIKTARTRLMEIYGGYEEWAKLAVLDQGGKYTRVGLTFAEMDMSKLDGRNQSLIVAPFGVPLSLITSRPELVASTYNNRSEDRKMFWQDRMWSETKEFEAEYQYYLQGERGEFVMFDFTKVPALSMTPQEAGEQARQAFISGGILRNEYRAAIGQDPADDGNVYLLPTSVVEQPARSKKELQAVTAGSTPTGGGDEGPVNLASTVGLNGAQVTSVLDVLAQLAAGTMAELVAVELLTSVGIAQDRAVRIVAASLGMPAKPIVTTPIPKPQPAQDETQAGMPEVEEEEEEKEAGAKSIKMSVMSQEQKAAFWHKADQLARDYEGEFGDAAVNALEMDKRAILALLGKSKAGALRQKATIDWAVFGASVAKYLTDNVTWKDAFLAPMTSLMTAKVKDLNSEFNQTYPAAKLLKQQWFNEYTIRFAQPINDTTNETIKRMVEQATDEGWTIDNMRSRLEVMFKQWMDGDVPLDELAWYTERMPQYRRENIARTETIKSMNVVSTNLYDAWGAPEKEWLATMDSRVRDTHATANGQVVKTGKPFNVGGYDMQFPGDMNAPAGEICNCRCTVIPKGI